MRNNYEILENDGILVIRALVDTLDFYEISESSNFLRSTIREHSFPSIVFDLSKVEFIDSSVFGFFIETRNTLSKNGREITMVCRDKEILHIISMLRIHEIIKVFPSVDAALAHLRS